MDVDDIQLATTNTLNVAMNDVAEPWAPEKQSWR
jgi:hypothetical protein